MDDVLSLLVPHLAELPRRCAVLLPVERLGVVVLCTSRRLHPALQRARYIALSPLEYEALAEAGADGCLTGERALEELRRKARAPEYRVERLRLLGPVRRPAGYAWTIGELAQFLGADGPGLGEVVFEDAASCNTRYSSS